MSSRSPIDEFKRRVGWALPALAALAFGIVRLPELTRSALWYDELFSVGVASFPLGESLRRIIADHTNPPLFYLLLKGWIAIGGDSDSWVRLLPCLLSMLTGAALVWLAREVRASALGGALAVALAAASPLSVDLATEVRGYSMLALLACLSLAAVLYDRRLRTRESLALATLINVALVHTHYFGWLTVAAEVAVALACWRPAEARRAARGALYTLLAFMPWAAAVLTHALTNPAPLRNVAWIEPPSGAALAWLLRDFTGRSGYASADLAWLGFIGVALAALALRGLQRRTRRTAASAAIQASAASAGAVGQSAGAEPAAPGLRYSDALWLLTAAGLVIPALIWAGSAFSGHSVWVQRYLMASSAPAALLVAIAVVSLSQRRWAVSAIVGFAWAAAALVALPGRAPTKFDWRRFTRRIELSPGSPAALYGLEAFTTAPLLRYARPGMRVQMVGALNQLPGGDLWLVYRRESFASGSATESLQTLGFSVITSLSAETAGQKIVAVRVRK